MKVTFTMRVAWVAAFAAIGMVAAGAQSLKVRQKMASEATELAKDADYTNMVCETTLAVKFDWAGAPTESFSKYSPSGYCNAALEAVRRVCSDTLGKDAVRQKIKKVTCGFGSSRAIELKEDGSVDYKIKFDSSNDADYVFEYLQNNL